VAGNEGLTWRIETIMRLRGGNLTNDAKAMGVSQCTLSDLLSGKRKNIGIETLVKICKYYDVSADFLLGIGTSHEQMTIAELSEIVGLSGDSVAKLIKAKNSKNFVTLEFVDAFIKSDELPMK